MTDAPVNSGITARLKSWALVVLSVAPFHLLLWQHLQTGSFATGFLDYDSPYYVANGREIFERGDGLFHPNPYDPDPAAPAIYFHWLTWLLGFGVRFLHADPGLLFAAMGVAASLVGGALTLRLVETVVPNSRGRAPLFLLTMWGGGLLGLGSVARNFLRGEPALGDFLSVEGIGGWWFLNWGRNFVAPMEAVYHCLVATAWLGVLARRWRLAIGATALLAATHPFSGLQHLMILGTWLGWRAARERNREALFRLLTVLAILGAFSAYYFWYLNSFAAHRALVQLWSTAWTMPLVNIVLATGPVALIAAVRLHRQGWRLGESEQFLLIAGAVTLLLMKHDWFISPHQPAHFGRGYNWLPFWLLALPLVQTVGERLAGFRVRWIGLAGLLSAAGLTVFDNAVFVANELQRGEIDRQRLSPDQRGMFSWMDARQLNGVLLTSDPRLSYLAATYTAAQPYYGHLAMTPDVRARWRNVAAWQSRGEPGAWLQTIDYILVDRTNPPANFDWKNWSELHRNHDYILLGREKR